MSALSERWIKTRILGSVGLRLFFADEAVRSSVVRRLTNNETLAIHRRLASAWRSRAGRGRQ